MGLLSSLLGSAGVNVGGGGILGQLGNSLHDNSGMLMGFATGGPEGLAQGQKIDLLRAKERQEQEDKAHRIAAAVQVAPQYGIDPEIARNDPEAAYKMIQFKMQKQQQDRAYGLQASEAARQADQWKQEFAFRQQGGPSEVARILRDQGIDPASEEGRSWIKQYYQKKMALGGGNEYGLTPLISEDGTVAQLGKDGSVNLPKLPEGFKVSKQPIKVDLGTHIQLIDPVTRQPIGQPYPKAIAEAAAQHEIGQAQGQAQVNAPNQLAATDSALSVLDQIENHPNREAATGWQSNFPTFKGGKTADFENLVEQAKSGSFLTAIQQMKGLGALSDAEGRAATAAVNRMNIATSDEGFMKAVQDYRAIVERGRAKALQISKGGKVTTPNQGGNPNIIQHPSGATIERLND